MDTKKKELVGNFANGGQAWVDAPEEVNAHDFLTDAVCRAAPYGLYDVLANRGHVVVGTSADTPDFAADAVASWWVQCGCRRYRGAGELLILADSGGSNGYRPRLWKRRLQGLADWYGLEVTVCHYPRGASKWNPVEHRLFSHISRNWAGVPLRTPGLLLALMRGTRTAAGLKVTAEWLDHNYRRGVTVSDAEIAELNIEYHNTCPQWNYTVKPRTRTGGIGTNSWTRPYSSVGLIWQAWRFSASMADRSIVQACALRTNCISICFSLSSASTASATQ